MHDVVARKMELDTFVANFTSYLGPTRLPPDRLLDVFQLHLLRNLAAER